MSLPVLGQSTNGILSGQWDFNQSNLKATIGQDLVYLGGTEALTTFESVDVNGVNGTVLHFPAADQTQGYLMYHGAQANGGGTNVNVYTLVMDLRWPAESDGTFRALFNTDTNNLQSAVMFVNPDDGVGINNEYSGAMLPDTWYRLALAFDLTKGTVTKYLNTTNVGTQTLDGGVDSRYSLGAAILLFTTNDGETQPGLVDRIQFFSDALTQDQINILGTPLGDGGAPPSNGDVHIDGIRLLGARVEITLSGNGTLQLQRKPSVTSTNWQAVGQVTDSGKISLPATDKAAFFRARKL